MSELWREDFIPVNEFSRPGTPLRLVRNIVIHYTANPGASAANHVSYFGKTIANQNPNDGVSDTYASAHMFVDAAEAVLIVPLGEIAYHASQANPYSIGIEMCIEDDGSFAPETVRRTVEIVRELCNRYGLNPLRDVIRHYDVTGKMCPKPYVDDPAAWEAFKQAIIEEDEPMLDKGVAQTIINTWIVPAWNAAETQEQKDYLHWLAVQVRSAAGIEEE